MAEYPAFPVWTDAYLADTTHLTTLQHGAFLLLLFAMWRAKGCRLKDDDRFLAKVTGLSPTRWRVVRPVLEPLNHIDGGWWTNKRLLDEREFLFQQSARNSRAGKASALKRKNRGVTPVEQSLNDRTTPTPTPTLSPTKGDFFPVGKKKSPLVVQKGKRLALDLTPEERAAEEAALAKLGVRNADG